MTTDDIPPLDTCGHRIMVCGPSNSGKSTLAVALGQKLGIPPVHLDQLRFQPGTDWVQRPDAEFAALHDAAILGDSWVMEGNYSSRWPQRLRRATGIILLSENRWLSLYRYIRRSLFEPNRAGALAGDRDSVKWEMVHWIMVASPKNLRRYRVELPTIGLPFIEAHGLRKLNRLYAAWGLTRG